MMTFLLPSVSFRFFSRLLEHQNIDYAELKVTLITSAKMCFFRQTTIYNDYNLIQPRRLLMSWEVVNEILRTAAGF